MTDETNPTAEQQPVNTQPMQVRVEVYIGEQLLDDGSDNPAYVYEKLIPADALEDLEAELDEVVGQYDDNPDGIYEKPSEEESEEDEDIFVEGEPDDEEAPFDEEPPKEVSSNDAPE